MGATKCPICGGTGKVKESFYDGFETTGNCNMVTCKACGGIGVIILPDK